MKLVQIVDKEGKINYVNADMVQYVRPKGQGSVILFGPGIYIDTKESSMDVAERLDESFKA